MLPNGHYSFGALSAQANIKRRRHFLTSIFNSIAKRLSTPKPFEFLPSFGDVELGSIFADIKARINGPEATVMCFKPYQEPWEANLV